MHVAGLIEAGCFYYLRGGVLAKKIPVLCMLSAVFMPYSMLYCSAFVLGGGGGGIFQPSYVLVFIQRSFLGSIIVLGRGGGSVASDTAHDLIYSNETVC